MICEPLELEYISSALVKEGHTVDLIDMLLEKKSIKYFLKKKKYDIVCMTSYITTCGVVKEYSKIIKEFNSNIITVVGGVHAEVVPNDFTCKYIDYILWANGVKTLIDLINQYPNIDINTLEGVYLPNRIKPKIVNGNLSFPDREITKKYRDNYNYIYHNKCATLKASFGCPYKCKFCFCTQICDYSTRMIENVIEEIQTIKEDNIFIVDDNFLVSRERIIKFIELLDKANIQKHYIAFGRADFIVNNEDLIIELHKRGFDAFFVGIESFKESELSDFSKNSSV